MKLVLQATRYIYRIQNMQSIPRPTPFLSTTEYSITHLDKVNLSSSTKTVQLIKKVYIKVLFQSGAYTPGILGEDFSCLFYSRTAASVPFVSMLKSSTFPLVINPVTVSLKFLP